MKIKYLIMAILLIAAGSDAVNAVALEESYCYCSRKCGPRLADEPGDAPFYDAQYGQCFCQERDRRLYKPNQCDVTNPNPDYTSYCDAQAE